MSSTVLVRIQLALALLFHCSFLSLLAQPIRVGSIADVRFETTYTLDGSAMMKARAKLLSADNFGESGTVSRPIEITDTAGEVDSVTAELLQDFDVFFVGWLDDGNVNAFSADELQAFKDWVSQGGVLIAACDDTSHDEVCSAFGHPITAGLNPPGQPTGSPHPIMHGPFGEVPAFLAAGNLGHFENTEGVTVVAEDSNEPPRAVIIQKDMGLGRAIFIGDVCIVSTTASAGSGIETPNDRLIANLFAFAGGVTVEWTLFFSQIGNGEGVVSDVVLANLYSSRVTQGRIELFGGQAALLEAGFESLEFEIQPRGTITLSTLGIGTLAAGAARVITDSPIGGVVRFSIPGVGIAGVGSSLPEDRFSIPVRRTAGGIDTGLALHNPGEEAIQIHLTLRDESGAIVEGGEVDLEIGPDGHTAQFVGELFPEADTDAFRGSLTAEVEGGKATGVALEFAPSPGQFTTLPVIPF